VAKKLTPDQRSLIISVGILQESDLSVTWSQLNVSERRLARNLSRAGLLTEKTNAHHRHGLAITDEGKAALERAE
jgi:predicted transcriptional regulator